MQYTQQKSLADDISEGKMSLPLIHTLKTESIHRARLLGLLQQRKTGTPLSDEMLKMGVDALRAAGGIDHAREVAKGLQRAVDQTLSDIERQIGAKNFILRLVQKRLELDE